MRQAIWLACSIFLDGGHAAAQDKPVLVHFKTDAFFRSYCYTGSSYLEFRKNGTYREIQREHMFVAVIDRGKWSQAESGEITSLIFGAGRLKAWSKLATASGS